MLERRRSLAGKQFETVTVTSNVSTTLTIWNTSVTGTSLTVLVPYGTSYTVSGADVTNYNKSGGGTYTASQATRSVSITYSIIQETVTVTSNIATTITINGSSKSNTKSYTVKVNYGTTYTVSGGYISGYYTPSSQSFTAGQSTRSVSLNYLETPGPKVIVNMNNSYSYQTEVWVYCYYGTYNIGTIGAYRTGTYEFRDLTLLGKTAYAICLIADNGVYRAFDFDDEYIGDWWVKKVTYLL